DPDLSPAAHAEKLIRDVRRALGPADFPGNARYDKAMAGILVSALATRVSINNPNQLRFLESLIVLAKPGIDLDFPDMNPPRVVPKRQNTPSSPYKIPKPFLIAA